MGEAGEDGCSVIGDKGVEERVPAEFDGFHEEEPAMPGRSSLLFRISRDGGFAGIFASHAQRNDSIAGGRGAIEKDGGSCDGTEEVSNCVSCVSFR